MDPLNPAEFCGVTGKSFEPITGIRQIVGHTPGHEVRYKKGDVCLDTHLHHYGLLEDGELTIVEQH